MGGDGFELLVQQGDTVKKGQTLIRFDKKKIANAGFNDTVAVLVTNADEYPNFHITGNGKMKFGEKLMKLS